MSTSTSSRRSSRLALAKNTSKSPSLRRSSRLAPAKNAGKSPGQPKKKKVSTPPPPQLTRPSPQQTLYLRINRRFLLLIPAATAAQPNPVPMQPLPGTTGNLDVIVATLPELNPYAGNTIDWLIDVANLIFDPQNEGSLYTFTTGTVEYWLNRDMDQALWVQTKRRQRLRATIYEYVPDNGLPVMLTKQSLRATRSVTTNVSAPQATQFRTALHRRDQSCVISHHVQNSMLIASHIIPRRLGDSGVQSVIQRFEDPTATVTRYDPSLGVLLFSPLDIIYDLYKLGFFNVGPNQYVIHNFDNMAYNLFAAPLSAGDRPLHGHQITLSSHGSIFPLPPVGAFNWHYIQCVLKKFSTPAYQAVDNIHYFMEPFRTRDDDDESDIDFDDDRNIRDPPYPSYLWDLSMVRAQHRLEAAERSRAIEIWNSSVSATVT